MTSTRASASNRAAAKMFASSNCDKACADKAISVTGKREKCTDTSPMPASMACVIGSSTVLDDGVSMPMRTRRIGAGWRLVFSGLLMSWAN
jgi:hypothetical protein